MKRKKKEMFFIHFIYIYIYKELCKGLLNILLNDLKLVLNFTMNEPFQHICILNIVMAVCIANKMLFCTNIVQFLICETGYEVL